MEYQVEVRRNLTPVEVKERSIKVQPFPGPKGAEGKVNTKIGKIVNKPIKI